MKIHEFQAKELLAAAGAKVPAGIVAKTPEECTAAFDRMGGKAVVLKAQIHAGGRGKGQLLGHADKLGGVKYITDRAKVAQVADLFFKYPLQTIQTGPEGQKVQTVLVQSAADIAKEFYLAVVLDRSIGGPLLMASAEGGMDIEQVAHDTPEKILKLPIDISTGLDEAEARKVAEGIGFTGTQVDEAVGAMKALVKVFMDKDCSLAEINPLALTPTGEVLVLDAKINFDDNALFRHPDVQAMRDESEENAAELRAAKSGLSFIQLDGNIGCLVNGAGLAMGTMDIIKYHGGDPANFLDVGGGANKDQVTEAFRILLGDPKVKAVLVNIFGGIMKCDTIADAILAAFKEVGFHVPLVVRLQGTNVELGRKILNDSGLNIQTAEGLTEAAQKVVAAAKA